MTEIRTWRATTGLRFVKRVVAASNDSRMTIQVLQQLWQCIETSALEWRDIPTANEGDLI